MLVPSGEVAVDDIHPIELLVDTRAYVDSGKIR